MSVEIGPLSERDEPASWTERYARFFLVPWFEFLNKSASDLLIKYDPRDNTVRLHGPSESPGDEYNRAMIVALPVILSYSFCFAIVGALPAGWPLIVGGAVILPVIFGTLDALQYCTVNDHTHAKIETEAVEELQEQFTSGEIDQEEFGERLEQEFEG